jgi:Peptidyl-prolyl cis-trans isomerase (rotamase) - cyclophilin family
MKEKYNIQIQIKNYGNINLELDALAAPITVANFIELISKNFYDGLTFHRIIDGFMIQGGDPIGNGTGGSDTKIKGEFAANGVNNSISHTRGAISMARSQEMDSARSQFFIVHENSLFLDGQYAGFGYVTSGIEVVDAITKNTSVLDSNGTVKKENQPIIDKIIILD